MATLVFEHSDETGSDLLGTVLRDHGHRLRVVRPDRGEAVPTDLDGIDAIVCCGGPMAPDGGEAWVEAEMALLRRANDASLPVLGICFGSQILARALGGEVALLEGGIECGWPEIVLTPVGREDPVFAGQPWRGVQPSWHRYHVTKAPDGARVLAKSERCPIQAWAVGLRTYGIQYHPEVFPGRLEQWAGSEPEALSEAGLTDATLQAQCEEHQPTCERLARRLFEAIALCLMPLDRRFAGIAKDVHH